MHCAHSTFMPDCSDTDCRSRNKPPRGQEATGWSPQRNSIHAVNRSCYQECLRRHRSVCACHTERLSSASAFWGLLGDSRARGREDPDLVNVVTMNGSFPRPWARASVDRRIQNDHGVIPAPVGARSLSCLTRPFEVGHPRTRGRERGGRF